MTVEHDEDLLLTITEYASHGNVDIVITVNDVHSRHVGSEHLLQVHASAVSYHLLGDEGGGHRDLIE